MGGEGGLVMERVSIERGADALDRSVARAWREACAGLTDEQARALPWKELPSLNAKVLRADGLTPVGMDRTIVRSSDPGGSDTAEAR